MTLPRHHNPVRLITALAGLVALVAVAASPALRSLPWLSAPPTRAVGGYDAVNVLGPDDFVNNPDWAVVTDGATAMSRIAVDPVNQGIYAAGNDGSVYRCDASAVDCGDSGNWAVAFSPSDDATAVLYEPTDAALYVGTSFEPRIYKCDVSSGCDEDADFGAFVFDLNAVSAFYGEINDLIVADTSGGSAIFLGTNGSTLADPTIFRCLIASGCDDQGDWASTGAPEAGARVYGFAFDSAAGVLFGVGYDSSDVEVAWLWRCDTADGCDAGGDWTVPLNDDGGGSGNVFTSIVYDPVNGDTYVGSQNGEVFQCDSTGACGVAFDGLGSGVSGLGYDATNLRIYAGTSGNTYTYCTTTGDCGNENSWQYPIEGMGASDFAVDDTAGMLYAAGNSGVSRCDVTSGCDNTELNQTDGIAFDDAGDRMFVADYNRHRVLVYDLSGGIADGDDPVAVLGQGDFFGTDCNRGGSVDINTLCNPLGVEYDGVNDRLFVSDYSNNRILVFDASAITSGMDAAYVLGQPDFTSDACNTTQTGLCEPQNTTAYDSANDRLFVTDRGNNRVMVFDVDPGAIANGAAAINVIGQSDFVTNSPVCTIDQISTCSPWGLAVDADNQILFVSDAGAHRVTTFDIDPAVLVPNDSGTDGPAALNVLGQEDFTTADFGTTDSQFINPVGIAYDSSGERLFVADANHRVLQFDTTTIEDGEAAVDVYGQDDFVSGGSDTTQSSLNGPQDVVYLPGDDLIAVTDTNNNRILFFDAVSGGGSAFGHTAIDVIGQTDADGAITYVEGGANNTLQPSEFGFDRPKGVAFDTVGHRMFVADTENNRVLVFNLTVGNELAEYSADAVLGQADFVENGVGIGAAGMEAPMNMLYDENDDRLFVADTKNNRVLIFDGSDGITTGEAAVGVLGQTDFNGEAAVVSQTGMSLPGGLAYDSAGQRLFVAEDEGGRVMVFDLDDGIDDDLSDGEAAVNVLGKPDFNTGGASGGGASAACYHIRGIAYIPSLLAGDDALFITDHDCQRVMVFNVEAITDGEAAVNVLGAPDFVSAPYTAEARSTEVANGVAYDADNQLLFVQSLEYGRITAFDLSDGITDGEAAVSVLGASDFATLVSGTTRSQMDFGDDDFGSEDLHGGIAYVPGTDKLYTADTANHRILVFDVATIVNGEDAESTVGHTEGGVTFSFGSVSANNSPVRDGLDRPVNVVLDAVHHRLFVGDYDNARVLVYNLTANDWREDYIPDFVLGQPDFSSSGSSLSATGFASRPEQMAYDATNDRLFVLDDNGRVLIYDTATIVNGEAAVNVLGKPDFTTDYDGSATPTNIGYPAGLAYDEVNERLFVTDWDAASRVMVWDLSSGIIDGMAASWVLGRPDLSTGGSGLSDTEMGGPVKLAYDSVNQRLFVDDFEYERILVFDVTTIVNGEAAVNVLGKPDFTTEGTGTSATEVSGGWGMDYDETDERLFYADYSNNRIMVWDFSDGITDGMAATDLYGQTSFSEGASGLSDTEFSNPNGVFYDETHSRLYVADTDNHRVLVFGSPPTGSSDNNPSPPQIGFTPLRIEVNDEEVETDSRNVLVKVFATSTDTFTGTVDILLSNDPRFATFIPFRYVIPERRGNQTTRDIWPKTMAWDLCFGLEDPDDCDPGRKVVYARFYVNVPAPTPQLLPTPETAIEHPDEP